MKNHGTPPVGAHLRWANKIWGEEILRLHPSTKTGIAEKKSSPRARADDLLQVKASRCIQCAHVAPPFKFRPIFALLSC